MTLIPDDDKSIFKKQNPKSILQLRWSEQVQGSMLRPDPRPVEVQQHLIQPDQYHLYVAWLQSSVRSDTRQSPSFLL